MSDNRKRLNQQMIAFSRSKQNTYHVGGETFHDREKAVAWARAHGYTTVTERAFRSGKSKISQETPTREIQV